MLTTACCLVVGLGLRISCGHADVLMLPSVDNVTLPGSGVNITIKNDSSGKALEILGQCLTSHRYLFLPDGLHQHRELSLPNMKTAVWVQYTEPN